MLIRFLNSRYNFPFFFFKSSFLKITYFALNIFHLSISPRAPNVKKRRNVPRKVYRIEYHFQVEIGVSSSNIYGILSKTKHPQMQRLQIAQHQMHTRPLKKSSIMAASKQLVWFFSGSKILGILVHPLRKKKAKATTHCCAMYKKEPEFAGSDRKLQPHIPLLGLPHFGSCISGLHQLENTTYCHDEI